MRNTFLALAAALVLSANSGCGMMHGWWCHRHDCDDCCDCGDDGCCRAGSNCGNCGCNGNCDSGNCDCGNQCACGNGNCRGGNCGTGALAHGDCQQCGYDGCPIPGGALCRAAGCAAGCCCGVTPAVADQLGGPAGPPCPDVTYPYYTVRGPRDFLAAHPTGIGP